ncbi:protein of unknown function [Kyrpidia spormannii]|uniref:Uncharacterized protein n=1 Tax=Kyrpidia spormannii TaxID=2055160 RepID=A0ACA8ZE10_9BACL|nr:protein of unknown function [Kyrpidia spormannii]
MAQPLTGVAVVLFKDEFNLELKNCNYAHKNRDFQFNVEPSFHRTITSRYPQCGIAGPYVQEARPGRV